MNEHIKGLPKPEKLMVIFTTNHCETWCQCNVYMYITIFCTIKNKILWIFNEFKVNLANIVSKYKIESRRKNCRRLIDYLARSVWIKFLSSLLVLSGNQYLFNQVNFFHRCHGGYAPLEEL